VSVAIDSGDHEDSSCRRASPFSFYRTWRHSLTLRFFDQASGHEVYKVVVTICDSDSDPQHAVPYLVKSAFAQLPFAPYRHWRVMLHKRVAGDESPELVSVEPGCQ
jgi:hypothetical protein